VEEFLKRLVEPVDKRQKRELAYQVGDKMKRNIYYSDATQLVRDAMRYIGSANVYVSVFTFNEYSQPWIGCLFFDFDAGPKKDFDPVEEKWQKVLEQVLDDVRRVVNFFRERYGVEPLVLYTGNRGFHIYIYTTPVQLREPKLTLKQFCSKIIDKLQLKYVDKAIIGDVRRIARLPYSKHMKTGLYCYPIDVSWSVKEIVEKAKNPPVMEWKYEITDLLAAELLEFETE